MAGNEEKLKEAGVTQVRVQRISTADEPGERRHEQVQVVRERDVTIEVDGIEAFTLLCTPADQRALSAGFLLSEGIITSLADVQRLEPCEEHPNVIRVRLKNGISDRIGEPGRNLLISSSCW